jgi:hypothetical protein
MCTLWNKKTNGRINDPWNNEITTTIKSKAAMKIIQMSFTMWNTMYQKDCGWNIQYKIWSLDFWVLASNLEWRAS